MAMGAYEYQALSKNGQTNKGVIEADSPRHARQLLRAQGLLPTQIQTLSPKIAPHQNKRSLSSAALTLLTRQLATLIAAGIPIEEALQGVAEQTETIKVRELLFGVRSKVLEGYGLAQAMEQYPKAFPELYAATIRSGEQTGRLDFVLEKLAEYTEKQQAIKQKVQQAFIYPVIMLVLSTAIISFLLSFVVPKMIEVFQNSGQALPAMTQVLLALSVFVKSYGLYLLFFLLIAFIAFKRSLRHRKVKLLWDRFLLKVPVVSHLIKTVNLSRYIHTVGILTAAGVNILETLRVASSLLTNLPMREAFDEVGIQVREGTGISEALKETGFIRPMTLHLISSGEHSGQLSNMMDRAANHLDNEVQRVIDTALTLLEPLIILFMGAVVLFIVLAILLPIFSMEQFIG